VNTLVDGGGGDLDYSAMGTVVFEMAGIEPRAGNHEATKSTKP